MQIGKQILSAILIALLSCALPALGQANKATSPPPPKGANDAALAKMVKKVDKMDDITWYRDKSSPATNNRNNVFLYIGQKDGTVFLRLKFQYASDSWLFIDSIKVKADKQTFERKMGFKRDHDSTIWEWSDTLVTTSDLYMINAIADSKEAVVRYYGQKYRDDKTISAQEKQAMKNVLAAFAALGGKVED